VTRICTRQVDSLVKRPLSTSLVHSIAILSTVARTCLGEATLRIVTVAHQRHVRFIEDYSPFFWSTIFIDGVESIKIASDVSEGYFSFDITVVLFDLRLFHCNFCYSAIY